MFDFMDWFYGWLNEDIYGFVSEALAYLVKVLTLGFLNFMLWAIDFGWGIIKTILTDLRLSEQISVAWNALPGDAISTLGFFRIPEAINNIVVAFVTRFVLRFIPGL